MTTDRNTIESARSADNQKPDDRGLVALIVDSSQLFAGRKEVHIRHHGELYRLLLTKNGKLILNK